MTQSEKTIDSPLIRKLSETERRYVELQESLNDPAVLTNPTRIIAASKESGQLEAVVRLFRRYKDAARQVEELSEMSANKADADMAALAASELPEARAQADALLEQLKDEFVAAEDNAVRSEERRVGQEDRA